MIQKSKSAIIYAENFVDVTNRHNLHQHQNLSTRKWDGFSHQIGLIIYKHNYDIRQYYKPTRTKIGQISAPGRERETKKERAYSYAAGPKKPQTEGLPKPREQHSETSDTSKKNLYIQH